ncbi:hypothetical protein [Moritella viscosa]|uniref:hypothetical protein n=1 Tax=Moritella viscosa TaxID=80854 RepID=UPI00090FBB25|nr:hypothetical protein [Moritella viscosa]SGZ08888.1 Putative uncharacterized protein [Moritella viscosa]
MSAKRELTETQKLTEARLRDALQRLLDSVPIKTKALGLLTLNKVNKEAGLGHSYIHKFTDFIDEAKPKIAKYNAEKSALLNDNFSLTETDVELTEAESFRVELNRVNRLKDRYRQERGDARKAKEELEALNNTLMYRLFELQEKLGIQKNIVSKLKGKS